MGGTTGTETLRFAVGTQVEVRISARSEPGVRVDMISVLTCDGGRWVSARVCAQHYRQDDWCPGFHCAYTVHVEGDVTEDGVRIVSAVREDDERCIRRAPPKGRRKRASRGTRARTSNTTSSSRRASPPTRRPTPSRGPAGAGSADVDQILSIASHAVGDYPLVGKRVRVDGLTATPRSTASSGRARLGRGASGTGSSSRRALDLRARANLYNLVEEFDCPICMEVV